MSDLAEEVGLIWQEEAGRLSTPHGGKMWPHRRSIAAAKALMPVPHDERQNVRQEWPYLAPLHGALAPAPPEQFLAEGTASKPEHAHNDEGQLRGGTVLT